MAATTDTSVTELQKGEFVITRLFDAPPSLVFKA